MNRIDLAGVRVAGLRYLLMCIAKLAIVVVLSACSSDDDSIAVGAQVWLERELPASAPAAQELAENVFVRLMDADGAALKGIPIEATIVRGGGKIASLQQATDDSGRASFNWALGVAPVKNTLRISAANAVLFVHVTATLDTPWAAESFVDVNAYLEEQDISGTTEDLAFDTDGRLLLAVPGRIIAIDAQNRISQLTLAGETLLGPLGLDYDDAGNLWVADSAGRAVKTVSPQCVVSTIVSSVEGGEINPNFVASGPDGYMYVSDACNGQLYRIDPQNGQVLDTLSFNLNTTGGPNGFAFDASGNHLYITTENTVLLCSDFSLDVGIDAAIAGLIRVAVSEDGFGAPETLAENVAVFGDGITFDSEGNLYAIYDTVSNLALDESMVLVLPEGETTLRRFLSIKGQVFANLAFGEGQFDADTLYIAMLSVPGFTPPETRGVMRFPVGIEGL